MAARNVAPLKLKDLARRFKVIFGAHESVPLSKHIFSCMKREGDESLAEFVERLKGAASVGWETNMTVRWHR